MVSPFLNRGHVSAQYRRQKQSHCSIQFGTLSACEKGVVRSKSRALGIAPASPEDGLKEPQARGYCVPGMLGVNTQASRSLLLPASRFCSQSTQKRARTCGFDRQSCDKACQPGESHALWQLQFPKIPTHAANKLPREAALTKVRWECNFPSR